MTLFSILLLIPPVPLTSQPVTDEGEGETGNIPGGILSENDTVGPVGNVDESYKFDDGFYEKIQGLILEDPQDGDFGVYDGKRYYNVIIVASRDDGDDRDPDETARENKAAIEKRLLHLGARDIVVAESLSFVTASIPVADIPGFALDDVIYKLGDGEEKVEPAVDTARQTIHATPDDLRQAVGRVFNGTGVVVAVVDTGINHTSLNDKVIGRAFCYYAIPCRTQQPLDIGIDHIFSTHGTRVAGVLAASGLPHHNGIAPGVSLLDAQLVKYTSPISRHASDIAHALDWSFSRGANVVNMSLGIGTCSNNIQSFGLITNEAVDKGMVVVNSAGNEGRIDYIDGEPTADYESISNPGCSHNIITVGGINDRAKPYTMADFSSRGPAPGFQLKPEIVAPAFNINTIQYHHTGSETVEVNGTSYAAPQVSATAAMMLQAEPELTPVEIKAALLLGASWQGPIPCSSSQYERNNETDNCSYAMQEEDYDTANNATSLAILNNVGFGILNASQSLRYVHSLPSHILPGYLDTSVSARQYRLLVSDTSEPVKIILTWLVQPHGGIAEQANRTQTTPTADLNFQTRDPDNNFLSYASGTSRQNNEFAVFNPPLTGNYTVTVTGNYLGGLNKPVQNYALASTHPLTPIPSQNHPPVAQPRTVIVSPAMERVVRLNATDADGDAVSFSVSVDPTKGIITTDEFLTKTTSRAIYTPDRSFSGEDRFQVTPHDGRDPGTPAYITLVEESLPDGSSDIDPDSDSIRNWDILEVTSGFAHREYSETFAGQSYQVSAIHVGSVNMEGADLRLVTDSGSMYTIAIPPSGVRMIEFASPITIRSATLSADGIDEEALHDLTRQLSVKDVRMFVGYVPDPCSVAGSVASSSLSSSSSTCPTHLEHSAVFQPGLLISDNSDSQDTTSPINVGLNGTISSISVSLDITHTWISDLKVVLTSPDGSEAVLHDRMGGSADNIVSTYNSSSHAGLGSMVGSSTKGSWTLSIGDYAGGDVGRLNSWILGLEYTPAAAPPVGPTLIETMLFSDDFTSLDKWDETGEGNWTISTPRRHHVPPVPGHPGSNTVLHSDNCDSSCTLTLKDSIDLTAYQFATLHFWRFIDMGLDMNEYLKVELFNGTSWDTVFHWSNNLGGDDNTWHLESYDLAQYMGVSDFKVRLVTQQSTPSEDVQLDDIMINATSWTYSIYVSNEDGYEVQAYNPDGTYLGDIVTARSGGLGNPWGIAFGPDSNLYVADYTYSKIRRYNGTTGAPMGTVLDATSAEWASTAGRPSGLAWNGNILYVASLGGVERFGLSGTSLGLFGDAVGVPSSSSAPGIVWAYDVSFGTDGRMYVAERILGKILYYDASTGSYLGEISSTTSPNTRRASGLAWGSAINGTTGSSLFQSGDDGGRVNEINPTTGTLAREFNSSLYIDEPYGMDVGPDGTLYVTNKDDDNVVAISPQGTVSKFVPDDANGLDDPKDVVIGPTYFASSATSSTSSASGASGGTESSTSSSRGSQDGSTGGQNEEPEFELVREDGSVVWGPITLQGSASFTVRAFDAEGDAVSIGVVLDLMPGEAISVTDHGNGTATVSIDASQLSPGTYVFLITVSDARNQEHEPYAVIVP